MYISGPSDNQYLRLCRDDSGGRTVNDEYGMVDNMTPKTALITTKGITVAIYLTKPPSVQGRNDQEIHLLRLRTPPADMAAAFFGRN